MTQLALLQIVTSFFVGGLLVAGLSLLAERVPPRVAGIILNLPSTVAVSFFFMAIALSPKSVANALPVVPLGLSCGLVFVLVYLLVARISLAKHVSMFLSATVATVVWLLCSLLIIQIQSPNIIFSLFIFIMTALVVQAYFFAQPCAHGVGIRVTYSAMEKLVRSLIAGTLIAIVVLLTKLAGPIGGSVMSTYPAATLSVLLILHRHYPSKELTRFCRVAPVGFTTIVAYAMLCTVLFPLYGAWLGTLFAYFGALLYTLPLIWVLKFMEMQFSKK